MTDSNHDHDFPADDLDRWIQDQQPPQPSSTFLERCLATISQADDANAQELARNAIAVRAVDSVLNKQVTEARRLKMRQRLRVLGISGTLAATVALFLMSNLWLSQSVAAQRAAEVLARGAEAASNPTTVHIVAQVRRHFPHIFPDADFVRAEVWKQFGGTPKWRSEQPGKVVVMDGVSTIGLFRRHPEDSKDIPLAEKIPHATSTAWDTYPLLDLANVEGMITNELRSALARGWDLTLAHETTPAGEAKLLVTVEAKAGLPEGDYRKNSFWDDSDMRRVYVFDAKSQRLKRFQAYLHQRTGDVLIVSVERIEYDHPLDPAVFSLKLPKNVAWITNPQPLPDNEKYAKMTPKEAARAFFEACAREDWDETMKFMTSPWSSGSKEYYGGLKIVHIGEPFQSARDIGKDVDWFVPYEVKLKSGEVLKHNLAMRKYVSAKRYIVDGGL
ncbi:MAG: hypothetical protein LLF97_04735 [Planctomycetaceae bacterium]|nr:hypothetical protein [Planctomycetaceae bacterium]